MAEDTCSVESCNSNPAGAYGWCRKHYARWRRYGDPTTTTRRPPQPGVACEVEECSKKAIAKGLCPMHYRRLKKTGTLGPTYNTRVPTTGQCSVDGCRRIDRKLGMCVLHYGRRLEHGNAGPAYPFRLVGAPIADRFKSKVVVTDACWLWAGGHQNSDGYGVFFDGERPASAHRFSYEAFVAPIPEGLEIDHLCRNRGCVNPEHLEAVTHEVNIQRAHLRDHLDDHLRGKP